MSTSEENWDQIDREIDAEWAKWTDIGDIEQENQYALREEEENLWHGNWYELALQHAACGWPVFPARRDKTPYISKWERTADTNADLIGLWWDRWPNALPAITPGRVKRTVIDVDRKPGKPDGFLTLVRLAVHIPPQVSRFTSLSGLGLHYWYRGEVSSRNDLYPGVDRKSRGGYVVATYELPKVAAIGIPLPVPFHGPTRIDADAQHPFDGSQDDWLLAHSGSTTSPAVRETIKAILSDDRFTGHKNMLLTQAYLVHLGREGHGGVPEALGKIREVWLRSPHASAEDPAKEWVTSLGGAIASFGGEV